MESTRQKKVSKLIEHDLAQIFQTVAQQEFKGILVSVTKVRVTSDLGIARIYLSVFPSEKRKEIIEGVKSNAPLIRHELAKRTRNQLRRMPELSFFGDDSLDYIEELDKSLRGEDENPIKNPDLLPRRKKQ